MGPLAALAVGPKAVASRSTTARCPSPTPRFPITPRWAVLVAPAAPAALDRVVGTASQPCPKYSRRELAGTGVTAGKAEPAAREARPTVAVCSWLSPPPT